jgi:hypothetical protein
VSGGSAADMAQRQASDRGVLACLRPTVGINDLAGLDAHLRRRCACRPIARPRSRRSRQRRPCTTAAALTFCMPCSTVSSDAVALGLVTAVQSRCRGWGGLARSGGIWVRWYLDLVLVCRTSMPPDGAAPPVWRTRGIRSRTYRCSWSPQRCEWRGQTFRLSRGAVPQRHLRVRGCKALPAVRRGVRRQLSRAAANRGAITVRVFRVRRCERGGPNAADAGLSARGCRCSSCRSGPSQ